MMQSPVQARRPLRINSSAYPDYRYPKRELVVFFTLYYTNDMTKTLTKHDFFDFIIRFGKNRLRIFSLFTGILLFATCLLTAEKAFSSDTIRVAVLKGIDSVRIEGTGLTVSDESGRQLAVPLSFTVTREKSGLSLRGMNARSLLVAASGGSLIANGKGFRNAVEILALDRGILVVNELPLEDYLAGIINCEISSQWSMEAVKAQAVVARSYAVFQREARKSMPYHLESSVLDQVYGGSDLEDSRAVRGVRETAGEVVTYNGKVIQAFFHSSCGGHTEASHNVWAFGFPYLQGVDCRYCMASPSIAWEQTLSLKKIESLLKKSGYGISGLRGIVPLSRNASGRIDTLSIVFDRGSINIAAVEFRKTVGYSVIKSTSFEVRSSGENLVFSGVGYGHGVGLCQWGAKKRAEDGFSYREILTYYYPGTALDRIY